MLQDYIMDYLKARDTGDKEKMLIIEMIAANEGFDSETFQNLVNSIK